MNQEAVDDVSILDMNLEDVPDLELAPEGQNRLVIAAPPRVNSGEKNDKPWSNVSIALSAPDAQNTHRIYHTLWLPQAGDDEDRANSSKRQIKNFMIAFGIPITGPLQLENWAGSEGHAILKRVSDPEREDKMVISKVVLGQ